MSDTTPRQRLETLYRAAIDAIQPHHAVRAGLDAAALDTMAPLHLLPVGKAADTMCRAALAWCDSKNIRPVGGVCISHAAAPAALRDGFVSLRGDHPHPRDASAAAARALGAYVHTHIARGDQVVVLLSGGTSALIGAPAEPLTDDTYRVCCDSLLRSGLDIHAHNAIRRQLSAWGNGRLGAALHAAGARTTVLAISDVPGDDPASIGSAPCLAHAATLDDVRSLLARATLDADARALLRRCIESARDSAAPGVPAIPHRVISSNRHARDAVAAAASGVSVTVKPDLLTGEAHECGRQVADKLLKARRRSTSSMIVCWGGEPVVSLPHHAPPGGRMQALALAAAQVLHRAGPDAAGGITLLAAGSDGRDGATDAAGAVIDMQTWRAIARAGADPAALLAAHDSHSALRTAGCLIPAFASGTNVNDLVIALVAVE